MMVQRFKFVGLVDRKTNHSLVVALAVLLTLGWSTLSSAQSRQFTLFGDVLVDDSQVDEFVPSRIDVFLYKGGFVIGRQTIDANGRYRFMNLSAGMYEVAIEIENREVARLSKLIAGQLPDDIRLDINLAWRSTGPKNSRPGVISAADSYSRTGRNKTLFQKAIREIQDKNYDEAIAGLREITDVDPGDYPAWYQLGAVHFVRKEYDSAERCFLASIEKQSSFLPSIFNLGRLRMAKKNYDGAIDAFQKSLKIDSRYAPANYFMGEAYLQLKKGSLAVVFFNAALKLDPVGMADAHLRLATLYNQAGYRGLAAAEYERFLQKKPDYSQRKKLEEYISANKSKSVPPKP